MCGIDAGRVMHSLEAISAFVKELLKDEREVVSPPSNVVRAKWVLHGKQRVPKGAPPPTTPSQDAFHCLQLKEAGCAPTYIFAARWY